MRGIFATDRADKQISYQYMALQWDIGEPISYLLLSVLSVVICFICWGYPAQQIRYSALQCGNLLYLLYLLRIKGLYFSEEKMQKNQLSALFEQLHRQAVNHPGETRRADLAGGARVSVRYQAGEVAVTVSRKDKQVGDRELVIFRSQFGIPVMAKRVPKQGQRLIEKAQERWYAVCWKWGV